MAHELGGHLDAPAFQDYAMQRLYRAYSVNAPKAIATPLMFQTVEWEGSKLRVFLEDCVIRNWGDDAEADHELAEWSQEFCTSERFLTKFARAMGGYFVGEETAAADGFGEIPGGRHLKRIFTTHMHAYFHWHIL